MTFKNWLQLIGAVLVCEGAGIVGAMFTAPNISGWYAGLVKPALNPPSWIFAPVWTALYALMGVVLFLVWRHIHSNVLQNVRMNAAEERVRIVARRAVWLFALQLILNALWSPIFFGMQNSAFALLDIALLWLAVIATTFAFWKVSRTAAWFFAPYVLWVTFAGYLNLAIVLLNP